MGRIFLFIFICLIPLTNYSQISGKVYSVKDSVALQGVSVYYDGTSIGAVTNARGEFSLNKTASSAPLVISFLGYEDQIIYTSQKGENRGIFYLTEKTEHLAEVLIEPDTWSRKKKMSHFKREFLGSTPAALKCKIKNEENIELRYNPSKKVLTAYSPEPLVIINRHLGYELRYNLTSFSIEFAFGNNGLSYSKYVAIEGSSFFKELRKKPRKKFLKNRQRTYIGSTLHFMRSLVSKSLEENNFQIFAEGFLVSPSEHISVASEEQGYKVELLSEKISILHMGIEQTDVQAKSSFKVDELGNHTPPLALLLNGEMSQQRIADLLPLNYFPTDNIK